MKHNTGTIFKLIVSAICTIGTYLFGGWTSLHGILLAFVVVDYMSGMVASSLEGELNSKIGFKGIAKKVTIFVIVAVAHLVDEALGTEAVMMAVIYFYLANELLSITENAGRIGIPIPKILTNAVKVLNGKGEKNE